ncbi:MAG: CAP domain-containing protein [Paracoccus sp. (in: a-proteobacteria)]|nr:CAP domain-containing protein [Paracoccus sp. (in: a-proteobacteria)]
MKRMMTLALGLTLSAFAPAMMPERAEASGACALDADLGLAAIQGINAQRRAAGMQGLHGSRALQAAARNHVCDMARSGRMSHQGSDGSTLGQRVRQAGARCSMMAENVAMGQRSGAEVVRAWQASAGHRANNMNRGFTQGAVAAARGADGRVYWVAVMGKC